MAEYNRLTLRGTYVPDPPPLWSSFVRVLCMRFQKNNGGFKENRALQRDRQYAFVARVRGRALNGVVSGKPSFSARPDKR